jgi:carboxyl-terminal processing protease
MRRTYMKRSFLTGFVAGLLGAVLLLLAGAYVIHYTLEPDDANRDEELSAQDTETSEQNNSYNEIIEKLAYMEFLIDNYYLENTEGITFADGIYKGFISSLKDPYSTYYTEEEFKLLMESSSGVYHGIGAYVSQDTKTGIITIIKPFEESPAYKAGLLPGDIIYKVDGEEVTGVDLTEVVSRMKGMDGTDVRITIIREGETEPLEFTITRKEIKVPTIEHSMLEENIGYIIITEFDDITISQFSSAVDELERQGMKGLIVDLRDNPGGLLQSVVKILDRVLPKGLIVYTEDKNGKRDEEYAKDAKQIGVPMTVLINGNSASASEIFAGAIQDYEMGTIVGTKSFGKGIVQKVIPLYDNTAIKLTISKYYTPKGRSIHGTGIIPDVEIDLKDELKKLVTVPIEDDNQLQEAIRILKDKIDS